MVNQISTNADLVIQLEDVHKIYMMGDQQVNALAGVSTSFCVGGFYAIMGPSGSGKSTMLNLLGCLDRPSLGRYVLEGPLDMGQISAMLAQKKTPDSAISVAVDLIGKTGKTLGRLAEAKIARNR